MLNNNANEKSDQVLDVAVKEFIEEYDRLVSALKKDFRRGKNISCLSSLTAMKPLHSHLMETFVNNLESDAPESIDQKTPKNGSVPVEHFGYL